MEVIGVVLEVLHWSQVAAQGLSGVNRWLENESSEIAALLRILPIMGRRKMKQVLAMVLREDVVKAQAGGPEEWEGDACEVAGRR